MPVPHTATLPHELAPVSIFANTNGESLHTFRGCIKTVMCDIPLETFTAAIQVTLTNVVLCLWATLVVICVHGWEEEGNHGDEGDGGGR